MRLADLVAVSAAVAETSGRLEKIDRLAALLKKLAPDEIETAVAFLSGSPRQGRIGIGSATVYAAKDVAAADTSQLDLRDVDAAFDRITIAAGAGSTQVKA